MRRLDRALAITALLVWVGVFTWASDGMFLVFILFFLLPLWAIITLVAGSWDPRRW